MICPRCGDNCLEVHNNSNKPGDFLTRCYCCDWVPGGSIRVATCGGFDPLHDGHIDLFWHARRLGTELTVMVNPDRDMLAKHGRVWLPLEARMSILKAIEVVTTVVEVEDTDGTVAETLAKYRPHIFAKGGDRIESNMPEKELQICKELGIRIVYGCGEKIRNSSDFFKES